MVFRSGRRSWTVAAIVLSLSLATTPLALADAPVSHSGAYGAHGLIDSRENPAATCHYDRAFDLTSIVVRAPIVYARNSGPGTQTATVGWRFRVQASSGLGFGTTRTTRIVKATATDARPAGFTKRSVSFGDAAPVLYRVRVDMYWYDRHGRQIGRATHAPEWYGWVRTSHGSGIDKTDECGPVS